MRGLSLPAVIVFGAIACTSVQTQPEKTSSAQREPREDLIGIPIGTDPDGQPLLLQATIYRPERQGRVPLVIMNHGAPPTRDADKRRGTRVALAIP